MGPRSTAAAVAATGVLAAPLFVIAGAGADAGPPATAAATRVALKLHGGYSVKVIRACRSSSTHHYTYYRRGKRIAFAGRISPAPRRAFRVEVKLKKCRGDNFKTIVTKTVRGRAGGRFTGRFGAPGRGDFYVRAEYANVKGKKEQLRVP